ncbi:hypothetical protein HJG53_17605 [Sphingomonas sp. ID1715]|uniref:hypothetical protein n=1 Tax=Sphingomonas sp. ID1715 TaxID=1656898 RepID=UPI001489DEFD|nr:hypothetical protein [Sphingomonas sp. ID1715]NNM78706.1 hypothetical protein [Sphingomonas sp. ID1715]
MNPLSGTARLVWPLILSLGAFLGSWATACIFPFAGFAAVSALTTDLRRGLAAVFGVWAMNQAVGYSLLGYPTDTNTLAWGLAIGAGAFAGFFAARAAARLPGAIVVAPVAAFATYELLLFAVANAIGGLETFSGEIVLQIARNDAFWFAGLMAARFLLTRTAPALFGSRTTLQPA